MKNADSQRSEVVSSLDEMRAKAEEIIKAAKATEKQRRRAARDAVNELTRQEKKKLAMKRKALLKDHERREVTLKLKIGSAMLERIEQYGLEAACLTPADFKDWSCDAHSMLIDHLWTAKELQAERNVSGKQSAARAGRRVEGAIAGNDRPVDGDSSESGETH